MKIKYNTPYYPNIWVTEEIDDLKKFIHSTHADGHGQVWEGKKWFLTNMGTINPDKIKVEINQVNTIFNKMQKLADKWREGVELHSFQYYEQLEELIEELKYG